MPRASTLTADFHHESSVYVGGEERSWDTLPPEDQLDYIRGYAQAAASRTDPAAQPAGGRYSGWRVGCGVASPLRPPR